MLTRVVASNGVVYYASPLLTAVGIPHAFSSRLGGVSRAPYDSLNFGNPIDSGAPDSKSNIAENVRRLLSAIHLDPDQPICAIRQVHGNAVIESDLAPITEGICGDAMISSQPHDLLTIRTADCVPILISTIDGKIVAAVHAGWRGIVADVLTATVGSIRARTDAPLVAAVGPCISRDAFEVGEEVLDAFEELFGSDAPLRREPSSGKGFVDLRAAACLQLMCNEISDESIDISNRCTVRHGDEFFSHRRDHGHTGRMIAVIAARPA